MQARFEGVQTLYNAETKRALDLKQQVERATYRAIEAGESEAAMLSQH